MSDLSAENVAQTAPGDKLRIGSLASCLSALRRSDHLQTAAPYVVLSSIYTLAYLAYAALPGNNIEHPLGWWGWWDQSLYLRSARALGLRLLTPEAHWYPLGYSLLGAPWTRVIPAHPFYFVNLLCLLGALFCFVRIGRAVGVRDGFAAAVFIGCIAVDRMVLSQFVVPWNTTPVMFYVYGALALTLRKGPLGLPVAVTVALCAALVLVTRPSDMVVLIPVGTALICRLFWFHRPAVALGHLLSGAVASGFVCAAYAALHVRIYGFAPSPYMVHSGAIGLNLTDLPQKLFAVLLDPLPLYGEGEGLLQRAPWIILAIPALPIAVLVGNIAVITVFAIVAINVVFYTAYADFLPHGIWRYNNVHYLKMSYPLIALMCIFVVRSIKSLKMASIALFAVIVVLSIRFQVEKTPLSATVLDNSSIKIITDKLNFRSIIIKENRIGYKETYFEDNKINSEGATLRNIYNFRSIPVDKEMYIIFFGELNSTEIDLRFTTSHGYALWEHPIVEGVSGRFVLQWPRIP